MHHQVNVVGFLSKSDCARLAFLTQEAALPKMMPYPFVVRRSRDAQGKYSEA
jgi:hypothetical protein